MISFYLNCLPYSVILKYIVYVLWQHVPVEWCHGSNTQRRSLPKLLAKYEQERSEHVHFGAEMREKLYIMISE